MINLDLNLDLNLIYIFIVQLINGMIFKGFSITSIQISMYMDDVECIKYTEYR